MRLRSWLIPFPHTNIIVCRYRHNIIHCNVLKTEHLINICCVWFVSVGACWCLYCIVTIMKCRTSGPVPISTRRRTVDKMDFEIKNDSCELPIIYSSALQPFQWFTIIYMIFHSIRRAEYLFTKNICHQLIKKIRAQQNICKFYRLSFSRLCVISDILISFLDICGQSTNRY